MDSFDNSEPDEDYNEGKSSSEMNNLLENTDSDVLRADGRGFDGFDRLENESKKYDMIGSDPSMRLLWKNILRPKMS